MPSPIDPTSADSSAPTPQKIVSQFASDPDMVELVQMFVDEMPHRVRAIQDQWRAHSFTDLRRTAHQIKGASGGYGFPTVGQVAAKLEQVIPFYAWRHMVRPGLTGWAQINFPYGGSVEDARRKLEFDLYYIRHFSLLTDVVIVLRTLTAAMHGGR